MTVYHDSFIVQSDRSKPMFHDVTDRLRQIVTDSGVTQGIATVYSQHTTCSIMLQEESHDSLFDGTKFLFQDLIEVLEAMIPTCNRENQYMHPGPEHIKHAVEVFHEQAEWSLNTEAHLRSCLIGRSETIPVLDGSPLLGEFGRVFFADFDVKRERHRTVRVQVVGE